MSDFCTLSATTTTIWWSLSTAGWTWIATRKRGARGGRDITFSFFTLLLVIDETRTHTHWQTSKIYRELLQRLHIVIRETRIKITKMIILLLLSWSNVIQVSAYFSLSDYNIQWNRTCTTPGLSLIIDVLKRQKWQSIFVCVHFLTRLRRGLTERGRGCKSMIYSTCVSIWLDMFPWHAWSDKSFSFSPRYTHNCQVHNLSSNTKKRRYQCRLAPDALTHSSILKSIDLVVLWQEKRLFIGLSNLCLGPLLAKVLRYSTMESTFKFNVKIKTENCASSFYQVWHACHNLENLSKRKSWSQR